MTPNEYGLFHSDDEARVAAGTEHDVDAAIGPKLMTPQRGAFTAGIDLLPLAVTTEV